MSGGNLQPDPEKVIWTLSKYIISVSHCFSIYKNEVDVTSFTGLLCMLYAGNKSSLVHSNIFTRQSLLAGKIRGNALRHLFCKL